MISTTLRFLVAMIALLLDRAIGDPKGLYRLIPHPVQMMGGMISWFDQKWNRPDKGQQILKSHGVVMVLLLCLFWGGIGLLFAWIGSFLGPGAFLIDAIFLTILLAGKSLYDHVFDVFFFIKRGDLDQARSRLKKIVGRDVDELPQEALLRASIETLAENTSDGLVAPVFFYLLFGLPGVFIYKLVNTADSMVGHKNERYVFFGWCAARLDDVLNYIPARLTAFFISLAAQLICRRGLGALQIAWRDGGRHASVNAGYPEAAMAGALDIAVGGPRSYQGAFFEEPWLNAQGDRKIDLKKGYKSLLLFQFVLFGMALLCGLIFLWRIIFV